MVSVCFYFQVHQPRRLRAYSVFDVRNNQQYYDDAKNKAVVEKVATKCYRPMNRLLLELIRKHQGRFRVSFSVSGVALEQFEQFAPDVIGQFQELARTGCVEFLGETFYHSLSFLYDQHEFEEQVRMHRAKIESLFGQRPNVFRNTELIYDNRLPPIVEKLGFSAVLAEGADHVLDWRSPNFVYTPFGSQRMKLLLKNYRLSDDIAFRFSNKGWNEWPLTTEKYARWVNAVNGGGDLVNLFMDYETFGEHQWEDTGIFEFMRALPHEILKHQNNRFVTVGEAHAAHPVRGELDIPTTISWADLERDVSAWLGNKMQHAAVLELYRLLAHVRKRNEEELWRAWRYLSTSDHFYYMCTKWFSDGDVHKYFNPYESPYDGYIAFMNVLNDLAFRLGQTKAGGAIVSERPSARLRSAEQ